MPAMRVPVLVAALALTPAADIGHAAQSDIDVRRSLVVTEQPILDRFPLERVLDQLVAQSGVSGLTALGLFQQWWDTQNPAPGLGAGPHCDDATDASGQPVLNAYPYGCRPDPAEGLEATSDPFANPNAPEAYLPIGLFNRFDVAPADGSHCGEHRIVYARRSGVTSGINRNLVIFEAVLPNPHAAQGLKGCHVIAKFWADLTKEPDVMRRADLLERFYFRGLANVGPVVHVDNFGSNPLGAGQVRTNQFMQPAAGPKIWALREFKVRRTCGAAACTGLQMVPVTDKVNPFGPLFSPIGTHSRTAEFQQHLTSQVASLAASSVMGIDMKVPDAYNTGQSLASGSTENDYVAQFGTEPSDFRAAIDDALLTLGSVLDADDIVSRAEALSCAGCHQLSNNASLGGGLVWPSSLGFTHVTERETETVDGVTRFRISDALVDVFLPKRKQVLDDFMNDKPLNVRSPKDPVGGRRTH
jgi:hypothetical protein